MTDTTSPASTPMDATRALNQHVQLEPREWLVTYLLTELLQDNLPVAPGGLDSAEAHPVVQLVASDAFGRHLAARVRHAENKSVAVAFLQLVVNEERLRAVIDEAGLQNRFLTYKND